MYHYPQRTAGRRGLALVVLFLTESALVDLITPSVFAKSRQPELPMLFLGAVAGQAGLLAIYAVLGPQRLLVRWPASLLGTGLLWGVFLLGMAIVHIDGLAKAARGTLMVPLLLLALQSPLWILKMRTGWRIVLAGRQGPASPAEWRQFRLQHMLGATTVVAAAFGLASLGLPRADQANTSADTSLWLGLMLACLVLYVLSGLSILPCLWAAFVPRKKATAAAAIAIYAVLMSVFAVVVISAAGGPSPPIEGLRIFVPFLAGLVAVMLGCLHLARWCGYILLRPRRVRLPGTPRDSSPFAETGDLLPPPSP